MNSSASLIQSNRLYTFTDYQNHDLCYLVAAENKEEARDLLQVHLDQYYVEDYGYGRDIRVDEIFEVTLPTTKSVVLLNRWV